MARLRSYLRVTHPLIGPHTDLEIKIDSASALDSSTNERDALIHDHIRIAEAMGFNGVEHVGSYLVGPFGMEAPIA